MRFIVFNQIQNQVEKETAAKLCSKKLIMFMSARKITSLYAKLAQT